MILRIAAEKRHLAVSAGSRDFVLFSYGDFFEPGNIRWGSLRFMNDVLLEPGHSLPLADHDQLEVVTIVAAGEVRQRLPAYPPIRLRTGDVQVLSGTMGFQHVETNGASGQTHLYQLGLFPRGEGMPLTHAERSLGTLCSPGQLVPVASGYCLEGALPMNAEATVFLGCVEACHMVERDLREAVCALVYVIRGSVTVNGVSCGTGDQARVANEPHLLVGGIDRSEFILVEGLAPRPAL